MSADNPHIPSFFEWYENPCEERLRTVYRGDISQRETLTTLARDLQESPTYWRLVSKLDDALAEARKEGPMAEGKVILAFATRMYAAGSGAIHDDVIL
jgi:hypothetical protein